MRLNQRYLNLFLEELKKNPDGIELYENGLITLSNAAATYLCKATGLRSKSRRKQSKRVKRYFMEVIFPESIKFIEEQNDI